MRTPRALIGPAVLALAVAFGTAACGVRPETNAPIRITGDKDAAVPTTVESTEAPVEDEATTTTYFYGTTPAGAADDAMSSDDMSSEDMSGTETTTTMGEG